MRDPAPLLSTSHRPPVTRHTPPQKWGWVQEMYAFTISLWRVGVKKVDLILHFMAQPPWDSKLQVARETGGRAGGLAGRGRGGQCAALPWGCRVGGVTVGGAGLPSAARLPLERGPDRLQSTA